MGPSGSKVRVCHVCKVNQTNRQESDDGGLNVGKPKSFQKVIITYTAKLFQFRNFDLILQFFRHLTDLG